MCAWAIRSTGVMWGIHGTAMCRVWRSRLTVHREPVGRMQGTMRGVHCRVRGRAQWSLRVGNSCMSHRKTLLQLLMFVMAMLGLRWSWLTRDIGDCRLS
jgi:hypothetical protein